MKKPSTFSPQSGRHRTVDDFPEYRDGMILLANLRSELVRVTEQIESTGAAKPNYDARVEAEAVSAAIAQGGAVVAELPPQSAELLRKQRTLRQAVEQQQAAVERIRGNLRDEMYKDWRDEDIAYRREVVTAILETKARFDAWQAHQARMIGAGVVSHYGSPLANFSAAAPMLHALKSMRADTFHRDNGELLDG